jgi:hypothetical protein
MQKIQNLPNKFKIQNLSKFTFGAPDGKDDPILDACALKIAPIAEFLDENKSILVGDRGTGKSAVFRLLSEGALKFNNSEGMRQIYVPIDEELGYKTLRSHIVTHISDPANKQDGLSHRIVWELFIFSRCLDGLKDQFVGNAKFENIQNGFYKAIGWKSHKKIGFLDIITNTKKTFGVKLEGGHLGYVIPNFYTSVEPKKDEGDSLSSMDLLDLPRFKSELNSVLSASKSVGYILIDKLDEFVSGVDYQTQLETLQALMHCWRDYHSYPKIKLKLFLRRDLYERLDFSSIGKDKIDPRKVELRWTDEDIRQLIASRLFHNMATFTKGKLKIECQEEYLTIDKNFLREIRTLDAIPERERSFVAKLKRWGLMIRAMVKQRKRDAYDARTMNLHDMVHRAIITVFFPRSVNHKNVSNKEEAIELALYLSDHFKFSNGATTPRIILLYMQKCLEISRNYYRSNPEEEISQNDKGEYPIFLRDHLSEAYQQVRQLALETIIGLNHQWSRPAKLLMQAIARSKTPYSISVDQAKKVIGKVINNTETQELASFFAFYEHAGLFHCTNRTQEFERRSYAIPILFQRVDLDI